MTEKDRYAAVLPAGGLGKRMGSQVPKQLLQVGPKPIYQYSLQTFLQHPRIDEVVLVVPQEWKDHFEQVLSELLQQYSQRLSLVVGGAERWQSVRHGVMALERATHVLVHDVARPGLKASIIDAVLDSLAKGACLVARPASDTIKLVEQEKVQKTIDRRQVWLAQTPQACSVALLRELYQRMDQEPLHWVPTDEASILEHYGQNVWVVPGDLANDKITSPEDLERFTWSCGVTS